MTNSSITLINEPISLLGESEGKLAVVVFPKSPSKNFPIALSIATQVTLRQTAMDSKAMYIASFSKSERDAKLLTALLECVGSWKGVVIYASGRIVSRWYEFTDVLSCYLESCLCTDYRAHCFKIIDDPEFQPIESLGLSISINVDPTPTKVVAVDRYTFPCAKIYQSTRINPEHPASYEDQIQASAVKRLCNLCPRFDPSSFRKIGTKIYEIDVE